MSTATAIPSLGSSVVPAEQRVQFLPKHFGTEYLNVESMIFSWASRLSDDYIGEHWQFFELDNGGCYLAPDHSSRIRVSYPLNEYEGVMGADAFGIVVTLYTLCHIAEITGDDSFVDRYHLLKTYAKQHPEFREISAAID
ncbi:antirestriction protein [Burkholderia cepacia]|uniref:antirestriction protein n=1 Tax=Burkholderia cepacia TaxID=292 RepID=UPI001CF13416|nr:antirestriction protein [Burkholderia cepacia]MCA8355612.1 antirestriction protein [Burkholderia cepacia]